MIDFKPEDLTHVRKLAEVHNIKFVDRLEAINKVGALQFLMLGTSFASKNIKTGEQIVYIEPREMSNQDEMYFVALHEIGHVVKHHMEDEDAKGIDREIEASEWAFDNLARPFTDKMAISAIDALFTHLEIDWVKKTPHSQFNE
jgi:hypothetical protein